MKRRPSLLSLVLLLLLPSCTSVSVPPAAEPVHLIIVGTTDLHGFFNGRPFEAGGKSIGAGGLAVLSSYVAALRASNPGRVVLVDGGDLFQGTLESNLFEGEAVVRGYNEIGYTAAAVGNHEFDFGPVGPDTAARTADQDPLGALKKNAAAAKFVFLSANMTEKATGKTPSWARPSMLIDVAGTKLGIIGLSKPDTPDVTMRVNVETLAFHEPVAATVNEAADLRRRGADAVIVIAHIGGRCTDMNHVHDVKSCSANEEAMRYLQALPAGTIDGYFGGHSHAQVRQYINGVPAVEALSFSREFGTLDLWVDPRAHRVTRNEIRPHTAICTDVVSGTQICDPAQVRADATFIPRLYEGKTMRPDPKLTAIFAPYLEKTAKKRNEPLGVTPADVFTRSFLRESTLGDLLTDELRAATGADIAFMNSGGIRVNLPARPLLYADLFEVSPFENFPSFVKLTGAQIVRALRLTTVGDRGLLQTSGLRYKVDWALEKEKPEMEQNHIVSVTMADGSPLDPAREYLVVMPDFLTSGGDGLMPLMSTIPKTAIRTDFTISLRDLFVAQLRKRAGQSLMPKLDQRIEVLNLPPRKAD